MRVFESKQYTELVRQLGDILSTETNLGKYFGPLITKSEFDEHFERVHKIFKQSRVQNHKSKYAKTSFKQALGQNTKLDRISCLLGSYVNF